MVSSTVEERRDIWLSWTDWLEGPLLLGPDPCWRVGLLPDTSGADDWLRMLAAPVRRCLSALVALIILSCCKGITHTRSHTLHWYRTQPIIALQNLQGSQ